MCLCNKVLLQFYSEAVPLRLEEVGLGVVGGVVGSGVDGDEDAGAGRNRYAVDGCSGGGASSDATTEKTRALIGPRDSIAFSLKPRTTQILALCLLCIIYKETRQIFAVFLTRHRTRCVSGTLRHTNE